MIPPVNTIDDKLIQDRRFLLDVLWEQRGKYYGLAMSLLRSHHLAEDVISEAIDKIWSSAHINDRAQAESFVATVVRNCAYSALRHRGRRRMDSLEPDQCAVAALDEAAPMNPDEQAARRWRLFVLIFTRLTLLEAEVVFLRHFGLNFDGSSHCDEPASETQWEVVARLLGKKTTAVRQQWTRAIKKLRNLCNNPDIQALLEN